MIKKISKEEASKAVGGAHDGCVLGRDKCNSKGRK